MSTQTNGSIRGWITYRKLESLLGGDQTRRLHRFPAGSLSYSNILKQCHVRSLNTHQLGLLNPPKSQKMI